MRTILMCSGFFGVLAFSPIAQAQFDRDSVHLSYSRLSAEGTHAWDAGFGFPPLRLGEMSLGSVSWINSFNFRQTTVPTLDGTLGLSQLSYTPLVIVAGQTWRYSVGVPISFRTEGSSPRLEGDALFASLFFSASRAWSEGSRLRFSVGAVIPDRSSSIPIIPGVGLDYESEDRFYQLRIGFPVSWLSVSPEAHWKLGLYAWYEDTAFALPDGHDLRTGGVRYASQTRLSLGGFARWSPVSSLWLNARLAWSVLGDISLKDREFEDIRKLRDESGASLSVGLSYRFGP